MTIIGAIGHGSFDFLFRKGGNEMNESIKAIKEEINKLMEELYTLRRANSAYFVMWTEVGSSWDCYSRYYTPIGKITEDLAIKTAEEAVGDYTLDSGIREVSEHEYNLFKEGAAIAKVLGAIRNLNYITKELSDSMITVLSELDTRDQVIRQGLGFKYSWEYFLPEAWAHYDDEEEVI